MTKHQMLRLLEGEMRKVDGANLRLPPRMCWDCGSPIPGHHTKLCDLAGDEARDVPARAGTQWADRNELRKQIEDGSFPQKPVPAPPTPITDALDIMFVIAFLLVVFMLISGLLPKTFGMAVGFLVWLLVAVLILTPRRKRT